MGPASDAGAVVDPTGRLHGSENVYIVDASIMPTIPASNTHLPVIAVAERIAELLARALKPAGAEPPRGGSRARA